MLEKLFGKDDDHEQTPEERESDRQGEDFALGVAAGSPIGAGAAIGLSMMEEGKERREREAEAEGEDRVEQE